MKKVKILSAAALLLVFSVFALGNGLAFSSSGPLHKIVVFKAGVEGMTAAKAIKDAGGSTTKELGIIRGRAVILPSQAAEKVLAKNPAVLRIDDDIIVDITKPGKGPKPPDTDPPLQPAEILPWGVDRIDADLAWETTRGLTADGRAVKVAVIDTGVDIDHPDLQGRIEGGINTIHPDRTYQDDNGHGTHVAGIIAAADNEIGVVGAAPEIKIYAVKALNHMGRGRLSDIIGGIQWAVENDMDVINMSLGTSKDVRSFHDAVTAAFNAGIVQVAAAGNSGPEENTVEYPAKYPETIAVSAIDIDGAIPFWSSRGPEVDLAAPGVSIYSTFNNDLYIEGSGTSMAAPHVTAVTALTLAARGEPDPAGDSVFKSPEDVKIYLKMKAEDLGLNPGLQGAGLVDAEASVQ